ncbi:MAG: hypothetical protein E6G39_03205 [Actinobacteria bacterium]|nr:MAG: hypothetical protein E6G39_03205 [Actinomycetota bacterium]
MQEHAHLFFGQAHQAEEYRGRKELGELLGEVALATVDEHVDEAVHTACDVGFLLVHTLGREQRVEELAVLRMHRWVDIQRDHRAHVAQAQIDDRRELLVMTQDVFGVGARVAERHTFHGLREPAGGDQVEVGLLRRGEIDHRGHRHLHVLIGRGGAVLGHVGHHSFT